MTKDLQKYADVAMFKAAPINSDTGPQVQLLSCNNDPLGTIASAALMYEGKYVENLAEITDEQRRYYLDQTAKTALAAPLEFVNFHFIISGVTRGFTHQMVRQRTATYTQESTRFAVKEDVPVGRPPSLDGTVPWDDWLVTCAGELGPFQPGDNVVQDYAWRHGSDPQHYRKVWDDAVDVIGKAYNELIDIGMPAEDARGLLPTNLLTRINYNTSLRGLLEHSGVRLCTQAQQEWVTVWTKIKEAIIKYGAGQTYDAYDYNDSAIDYHGDGDWGVSTFSSQWQFEELSKIFKPICFQTGKCQFKADVDRHCIIRPRVDRHAKNGTPSSEWHDIDLQTEVYDNYAAARISQ
jgi:thymidylate synthase (FAD)